MFCLSSFACLQESKSSYHDSTTTPWDLSISSSFTVLPRTGNGWLIIFFSGDNISNVVTCAPTVLDKNANADNPWYRRGDQERCNVMQKHMHNAAPLTCMYLFHYYRHIHTHTYTGNLHSHIKIHLQSLTLTFGLKHTHTLAQDSKSRIHSLTQAHTYS